MQRHPNSVAATPHPWYMEADALQSSRLSGIAEPARSHVQELVSDGVTVIPASVSAELCDRVLKSFTDIEERNADKFLPNKDQDGHYPRIVNLHLALPELFWLFSKNPIAIDVQREMFGAEPCLYTSLFYERGSAQPAHRDTPYFTTRPEYFYLGVWVALEDTDENNGALQVIRGGHLIPELDRETLARRRYPDLDSVPPSSMELWTDYQGAVQAACDARGLKTESVPARKGDTIIWHPQLPHGGSPIRDIRRSRYSLVMHTTPLGVPVYHQHVFFNPRGRFSTEAPWEYESRDGYAFAAHSAIGFGHAKDYPASAFV